VLPAKIQHLTYHLDTIKQFGADGVFDHSLQVLGCFLGLSVLIWESKSEPHPVRPLLALTWTPKTEPVLMRASQPARLGQEKPHETQAPQPRADHPQAADR
jgi:hypothetical protein